MDDIFGRLRRKLAEKKQNEEISKQKMKALLIDPLKKGSSERDQSLKNSTQEAQQKAEQEARNDSYKQAEYLRKKKEAMKASAAGLSNLANQAKKRK